jgi:hypothetical protein
MLIPVNAVHPHMLNAKIQTAEINPAANLAVAVLGLYYAEMFSTMFAMAWNSSFVGGILTLAVPLSQKWGNWAVPATKPAPGMNLPPKMITRRALAWFSMETTACFTMLRTVTKLLHRTFGPNIIHLPCSGVISVNTARHCSPGSTPNRTRPK